MKIPELARVQVGQHTVAYRSAGNGPALVLLHGFLCDSRVWRRQLTDLSDAFTVVAWDAPGAGSSSDPPDSFALADWGRCLSDFLDIAGIEQAHVLGLSWGGLLAQELYRLDRTRIAGLILADTYAGWRGSFPDPVADQRLERCLREASLPADEFVRIWVPVEFFTDSVPSDVRDEMAAVVTDFHPSGFRLMAKALADTDSTSLLPTIDVPTLLLWGDQDRRSPPTVAEAFRVRIPRSELVVIANAGHISNMEQPERFNAEVRLFCLSNPSR